MSFASLEWNCEELLIRKLVLDERLVAIPMRHWERSDAAILDCLIFRAIKDDNQLEGVQGYAVSVEVKFVSGTMTPEEVDEVAAAVSEAAYDSAPFDPELPDLYFASLEPETKTVRRDNRKTRTRQVFLPLIARLKLKFGVAVLGDNEGNQIDFGGGTLIDAVV